jgi:acetyl-CoA synthetase/medium-chain acyl-CoA synthetase
MIFNGMADSPDMEEYERLRREFFLDVPAAFSFPLDIFDGWGGRPALFWTDGKKDRRFTFDELREISSRGAGFLKKKGIRPGDKVFVMLPAIPEWWEIMLAIMRINAVPIPATTLLTANDIEHRLNAVEIKAIVTDEDNAKKFEDASGDMDYSPLPLIIGRRQGWEDYIFESRKAEPYAGEKAPSGSPALIFFTSGTTGPPKLVLHTQASYPLAHLITGRYWLDLRPGDLHWNLSDTGWAKAAWSSLFGPWHMGATVFCFYKKGKFDPHATIDVLKKYPITTFCGPPTAYRMMVKEGLGELDFKTLRHFVAAGEPLNREIINLWKEKTGLYIFDGYGQTETVNVIANLRCLPVRPGSMGMPVPGFDVDIVDEEGMPLEHDKEGDIAIKIKPVRPVGLFGEYLGNPDATRATVRKDWYITGDRGYKDKDGYFWFVGRADDVILTSGYRIGPFEIESILIEHPAVRESAVVASPDEVRGEVVKAFIVLMDGYEPSGSLVKEIQEFVKTNTAPYKYPRKVEFIGELPKTISGKIMRGALKKMEFGKG